MAVQQAVSSTFSSRFQLKVLCLPMIAIAAFTAFGLVPGIRQHPVLWPSFLGAAGCLVAWLAALAIGASRGERTLAFEFVPRKQHYIQAAVQLTVFAYWGWHWPQVYAYAPLLAAQVVFAYAVDMLLGWSRRDKYVLGFGPFPIIFSTNLFLWFRDDWFYLQFLMIALGFLGKEFVRWQRDGKSSHIFNPSAFSLGLFSLVLIVTGTTDLTWGTKIATTLSLAPNIYLVIFLLGLVVMYFFQTTLVTAVAAATLFGASALYFAATGVPYFIDSDIPIAVFLGLHLLVTDPSTSPRTPAGKACFGFLYGLGVFALYEVLALYGAPTFYDKLLCVPLLNLSVQLIDGLVKRRLQLGWVDRLGLQQARAPSNLAHMTVWIALFTLMTALGSTDGRHTGDSVPFWQQACSEGRLNACERLIQIESGYCGNQVGWACNELGVKYAEGILVARNPQRAYRYLQESCRLRFWEGCVNVRGLSSGLRDMSSGSLSRGNPREGDLRALLREGGQTLFELPKEELEARACEHGWAFACEALPTH